MNQPDTMTSPSGGASIGNSSWESRESVQNRVYEIKRELNMRWPCELPTFKWCFLCTCATNKASFEFYYFTASMWSQIDKWVDLSSPHHTNIPSQRAGMMRELIDFASMLSYRIKAKSFNGNRQNFLYIFFNFSKFLINFRGTLIYVYLKIISIEIGETFYNGNPTHLPTFESIIKMTS